LTYSFATTPQKQRSHELLLRLVLWKHGGDVWLLFTFCNSGLYQGYTKGQSLGKPLMGIRLCYVTQKYYEPFAYYCELTAARSCARWPCLSTWDEALTS
jgi:hypothetical protein